MDKIKDLLQKLGVSNEVVTSLLDSEKSKDIKTEDVLKTIRKTNEELLRNDEAFLSEIEQKKRGEVLNSKQKKFAKLFDVAKDEIEALDEKTRFDDLMELGYKKLSDKIKELQTKVDSGAKDDKTSQELEEAKEQVRKLSTKVREYEEETIPSIHKTYEEKETGKILNKLMKEKFSKSVEKWKTEPELVYDRFLNEINEIADIKLSEDKKSVTLTQKGKELNLILDDKLVSFDELSKKFVEKNKLEAKQEERKKIDLETGGKRETSVAAKNGHLRGLDKAAARAKELESSK